MFHETCKEGVADGIFSGEYILLQASEQLIVKGFIDFLIHRFYRQRDFRKTPSVRLGGGFRGSLEPSPA
jgi:hypothetical protein